MLVVFYLLVLVVFMVVYCTSVCLRLCDAALCCWFADFVFADWLDGFGVFDCFDYVCYELLVVFLLIAMFSCICYLVSLFRVLGGFCLLWFFPVGFDLVLICFAVLLLVVMLVDFGLVWLFWMRLFCLLDCLFYIVHCLFRCVLVIVFWCWFGFVFVGCIGVLGWVFMLCCCLVGLLLTAGWFGFVLLDIGCFGCLVNSVAYLIFLCFVL